MQRLIVSCVSLLAFASLAPFLTAGCASKNNSSGTATDEAVSEGSDGAETESNAESLAASFVSGSGSGAGALSLAGQEELNGGGDIVAQGVGDAAKAFYQPAGCLVVTNDTAASKATYVFTDCTGPYGLVHITGTVTVAYTVAGNTLGLTYDASGLKINNATIDWGATAQITANGQARTMVWSGHFTGTTGHGRAIQRTNNKTYTWTVGGDCLGVNGSSDGTVTGHELKVDVISYNRCKHECPESGSEIKITDVTTSKVYDLKYGNGDATYTGPNGGSITFTPWCAL